MKSLSPNITGAILMMLSMSAFTVNDAFMKGLAEHISFYQSIALRGVLITIGLLGLAIVSGRLELRLSRRDWALTAVRTSGEVIGTYLFLTALVNMPLANLSAILQSLPLTVTLGAALFFREPVGWRRLSAIVIGFLAVLLIVRPGTDGFTIYSIYGIGAVLAVTVRDLAARKLSKTVPSITVAVAAAIGVTIFAFFAGTGEEWQTVTVKPAFMLIGASLCLMVGYVASISAMRVGEIAIIAPFRYTSLLVALILGFAMFGEWPSPLTLIGAAILVATGLYTLHRERKLVAATSSGRSET